MSEVVSEHILIRIYVSRCNLSVFISRTAHKDCTPLFLFSLDFHIVTTVSLQSVSITMK